MRVLAIDPGDTIGIAIYDDGSVSGGTMNWCSELDDLLMTFRPSTVIAENFFIRRGKPSNYHSAIKQIGVIEYLCDHYGIQCELQSPTILRTMMKHVPDEVKISHIRSAVSHLLYFLLKNEIVKFSWVHELRVGELR